MWDSTALNLADLVCVGGKALYRACIKHVLICVHAEKCLYYHDI
jgi:hypothetical protein